MLVNSWYMSVSVALSAFNILTSYNHIIFFSNFANLSVSILKHCDCLLCRCEGSGILECFQRSRLSVAAQNSVCLVSCLYLTLSIPFIINIVSEQLAGSSTFFFFLA